MRRRKKRPTHVGTFMSGMDPILRNHHLDNVQSWERLSGYLKKKTLESFRFQLKCWVISRDRCCCRAFRFWITNYLMKSRVWGVINSFQWNANRRDFMNERAETVDWRVLNKHDRATNRRIYEWKYCCHSRKGNKGSGLSGRRAGILDHKNNLFLINKIFLLLFFLLRFFLELDERPFLAGIFERKSIVLRNFIAFSVLVEVAGRECALEKGPKRVTIEISKQYAQTLGKSFYDLIMTDNRHSGWLRAV